MRGKYLLEAGIGKWYQNTFAITLKLSTYYESSVSIYSPRAGADESETVNNKAGSAIFSILFGFVGLLILLAMFIHFEANLQRKWHASLRNISRFYQYIIGIIPYHIGPVSNIVAVSNKSNCVY